MAYRPKLCKKHKNHVVSCKDCAFTKRRKERLQRSNELTAKVNIEIEFLKSLPEDEAARRKIIQQRETARSVNRAAIKAYRGPPLITKKAKKAEMVRQANLNKHFNREAAKWTVVKKRAKIEYLKQNNPVRGAELKDLMMNEIGILMDNNELKLATAQKLAEINKLKELNERISSRLNLNHNETGNGN